MIRNWHDSWPGIDLDGSTVLDPYRTPYGGPETRPADPADLHNTVSQHAPYTTEHQNRGGNR